MNGIILKIKHFGEKLKNKEQLIKGSRKLFWAWIAYQAIKGTITTTVIWIPLLYYWIKHQ